MEAVTLGDTRGDSHALVYSLAQTLADVEGVTLDDTRGGAHALVNSLAQTLADVEAVTLDDTQAVRTHWSTLWLTLQLRWSQ